MFKYTRYKYKNKFLLFYIKIFFIKMIKKEMKKNKNTINFNYKRLPNFFMGSLNLKKLKKILFFLNSFLGKIIFFINTQNLLKTILKLLHDNHIYPKHIQNIIEIHQNYNHFYIIGNINDSFLDKKNNLLCICEKHLSYSDFDTHDIFNTKKKIHINSKLDHNLSNFHLNDPIVHIEHGIGRYQGLIIIKTKNITSEYLIISYAEDDKLYVPVSCLHLVYPYTETSKQYAPLHKLGGDKWNKEKRKIKKTICDHAAKLLDIYAHRALKKGFSFKKNIAEYQIFCNNCPFETTIDQNNVMNAVLKDMCSSIPMDRLVCGDVGFGKTEIAIRSAFLSVLNNKQVVILVPTTLLAQQHFENFKTRFFNWSITIDILSRFCSNKEKSATLKNIKTGITNILIGTHKLLIEEIQWYDLGLLIIDEEHRFGVVHKEAIKKKYSNIDILTLTATPIPRTLNMAITGIKNLSIISKPPDQRLTIKTDVQEYDCYLVKKVILREISRGGQVYYIYNKVKNIHSIAVKLQSLVPEACINIGHGKMRNTDLKRIITDFYHKKFNVLVCTTIIESGIDIPKANTIIIENADRFGLSQLHQLRGRIGRSHHQAYALFLVNSFKTISIEAKKRLDAIASVNNFHGGFYLSNQDLEIRGTGEILGKEQSGHMKNINYSLYIKLLKSAMEFLKNQKNPSLNQLIEKPLEVELHVPSLIPNEYISDINVRLFFYKKIANSKIIQNLKQIQYELISRFGKLPDFAKNLITISKIRIIAHNLGIKKITSNKNTGIIEFNNNNKINIKYLVNLLQKEPNFWKIKNAMTLQFIYESNDDNSRLKWIKQTLENFTKNIL
ncbi:MAG: transcription-repair coupling factor [Buchnera aphidicola (Pentalonia nigronervosa)]|uniref:Transcription-repair-coupling factor n=1 Tax=Buchnera aphidicola (Pentalonia nigronervosa) TaxID=1309793 RepID=A0A7H1B037_9GAMM|nr:MAG: transcription-repair coupling factor [Buchnera aphidicola (Pentalonia nigronervosa)]